MSPEVKPGTRCECLDPTHESNWNLMRGNPDRIAACKRRGMDIMYADRLGSFYETWTYSDGERVSLPRFYSIIGLQEWAIRRNFGIVYLEGAGEPKAVSHD